MTIFPNQQMNRSHILNQIEPLVGPHAGPASATGVVEFHGNVFFVCVSLCV